MAQPGPGNNARSALSGASAQLPPGPAGAVAPCEQAWVEVQMLGEKDEPVPGLECEIVGPDGALHRGVTDSNGVVRVQPLPPGQCTMTFPLLDRRTWNKA
jgi:hypothetical protein